MTLGNSRQTPLLPAQRRPKCAALQVCLRTLAPRNYLVILYRHGIRTLVHRCEPKLVLKKFLLQAAHIKATVQARWAWVRGGGRGGAGGGGGGEGRRAGGRGW